MTFRQLEYLETLALTGSITKAAEKLFVSQSALSQQLIAMEKEYQIQILDRSKTPMEFTENGLLYLQAARSILKIKHQLENDLQARRANSLCIKTVPFYAANLVPCLLSSLHDQYPNINVELKIDWAPNLFRTTYHEQTDLYLHAFDMSPLEPLIPDENTFCHEILFDEEILVAMSSRHPLLHSLSIQYDDYGWPCLSQDDLGDNIFILPSTSVRLLDIAHIVLGPHVEDRRIRVSDKGFDALIGQLQYSNYLAFLPSTTVRFCSSAVNIRFFRLRNSRIYRPVVVSYPANSRLSATARQFIKTARQNMAQSLPPR